ncbi:hypothetical protein Ndes2437A_g06448 [Nannochloris sp. 'desiccata']
MQFDSMEDISHATTEVVHSLCCAITACKELTRVVNLLQLASNTLLDLQLKKDYISDLDNVETIKNSIQRLAGITNVSAPQVHAALFSFSFQELAEVLLSVVAPDWLDRFPDEPTKQRLFYRWFDESSAPALLHCLSWHLSSVEPLPGNSHQYRSQRGSLVLPVSANIAAHILTQRFTEYNKQQENHGIKDILEEGIKNLAAAEGLAGLLAAVPDRVVLLPPSTCSALQADVFVPFLTNTVMHCVERDIHGGKYTPMAAEILSRVVQRGHTRPVSSAMAEALVLSDTVGSTMKGKAISDILAHFPASSALEKLLESLLRVLPFQHTSSIDKNIEAKIKEEDQDEEEKKKKKTMLLLNCLKTLLPKQLWQQHSDIRLLFQDKLLTQRVLSLPSLTLLLGYLDFISSNLTSTTTTTSIKTSLQEEDNDATSNEDVLAAATWKVASQWGDRTAIQRLPAPQQAYMTCILLEALTLLRKSRFEGYSGLLPVVLRGISTRLDSPREFVRRQAMRVGKVMSQILDGNAPPLFGDEDIELMPEEQWDITVRVVSGDDEQKEKGSRSNAAKKNKDKERGETSISTKLAKFKTTVKGGKDEDYPMTETDSDDDDVYSDSSSSRASSTDSEFETYDLEESDDDDVSKTNLQLRDIISLIQKSESDWKGHLRALRSAEALIRAAPDELTHYSVPLARTLLLTTAPAWANEELPPGQDPIEDQRFRSLVALTAAVPEAVGLSLAAEVYSPSLDMQQRSRALAVMAASAQELSSPGSVLKALEGEGSDNIDDNGELSKSTQRYLQGEKVPGKAGRVVRASERSLAAAHAELHQKSTTKANRFPPIALKWAAALLKECDVRRHGVDLFGRDHFILGRLLATLGAFLEASQQSLEAAPLASAVIELIKGQNVHNNEEPYVRRAALMAASHACMAVPPGAISTALLTSSVPSSVAAAAALSSVAKSQSSSSASAALVERLEWLRGWAEDIAENDSDNSCRKMAAACRGLQGALAAEAMASLAASVSEQHSLNNVNGGGNVILPSFSGGLVGPMPSVNVSVPRIESLNLK